MSSAIKYMPELTDANLALALKHVADVLEKLYGVRVWKRKAPIDELMLTLLSQNTNDRNRDLAYSRLRERWQTWAEVASADVNEIMEAIRPAGLFRQKSERMKSILAWVEQTFGGFHIDPVQDMNDEDAIKLLSSQKGIGVKTAAVTLAFSLNRDLCPVDTHVHRISKRLGWVEPSASAESTFYQLKPNMPKNRAAPFHLNILRFGREICTARKPKCGECPLWDRCVWEKKSPR